MFLISCVVHFSVGWIDKAVLFPVMKACFTYSMPEKEIRTLLSSSTLKSMASLFTVCCVVLFYRELSWGI